VTEEAKASSRRQAVQPEWVEIIRRLEEEARHELEEDVAVAREAILRSAQARRAARPQASS
jgi:hypothetical protein